MPPWTPQNLSHVFPPSRNVRPTCTCHSCMPAQMKSDQKSECKIDIHNSPPI
ncbi:hypothetical protein BS50DRAFT_576941 [Corynespora cassiicola Philippines]|uniref:Uncharacterized protein n=1 Tax=Corynespora cassiicola Philippines TaxID=1448308 RepID=A0A2T2ND39_CORCC|nr:hypothetical protein BS50DRAFT_576941 [Corynespora cassiicola Philippines]